MANDTPYYNTEDALTWCTSAKIAATTMIDRIETLETIIVDYERRHDAVRRALITSTEEPKND